MVIAIRNGLSCVEKEKHVLKVDKYDLFSRFYLLTELEFGFFNIITISFYFLQTKNNIYITKIIIYLFYLFFSNRFGKLTEEKVIVYI